MPITTSNLEPRSKLWAVSTYAGDRNHPPWLPTTDRHRRATGRQNRNSQTNGTPNQAPRTPSEDPASIFPGADVRRVYNNTQSGMASCTLISLRCPPSPLCTSLLPSPVRRFSVSIKQSSLLECTVFTDRPCIRRVCHPDFRGSLLAVSHS